MADGAMVFLVTGGASGDHHAAPVVAELQARGFRIVGVGGPRMAAAGAELLADSTRWDVVGVPAYVRNFGVLYPRCWWVIGAIRRMKPDLVVLCDFGRFNMIVATNLVRMGGPRVFYYFPPASWRQEPGDWSRLARLTCCVATPFSRNAEHLCAGGVNAHWVGHPVMDAGEPAADRRALRAEMGLPDGDPVIGLLPGSRRSERRLLGPRMLQAAGLIRSALPQARFLWSAFPELGRLDEALTRRALALGMTVLSDSRDILRASDLALVAMGTATLEAAAALTPMIATYDLPRTARWFMARLFGLQFYALPNLLLNRLVVPEVRPTTCAECMTADCLADVAVALWQDPQRLQAMRDDLALIRGTLGSPGVARRTADLIAAACGR